MKRTRWAERDWFSIRAERRDDEAEILIYDRIGAGFFDEGVVARDFCARLAALDVSYLSVRINSPGGSVFDGLAIYNALRGHPAAVTTKVDGLAASIASVIALAGDERQIARNALMMIHSPWSMALGSAEDLRAEADVLDKIQGTMAAIYAEAMGIGVDDVAALLAAETWYDAEEAIAAGLAETITDGSRAAAQYLADVRTFARTDPPQTRQPAATTEEATVPVQAATDRPDTAILERIDQLEARIAEASKPQPQPQPVDVRRAFAQLVTEYGQDRTKIARNAADMTSTGNTGLTSTERTSRELVDYFDANRYFCSHVMAIPFPESGIVHTLPKKTQRTQVGQAAEKAAPPSRALQTDVDQFTGVWYKGYLDISYELIRTSSPGAVQVAVDDMLEEAAVESELEFVAAVEAASTLGAPLDFTSYATLVASARAAVRAVRTAAGKGTPKIALTSDSFDSLLGLTDGDGRRILSTVGATNADGSASLVSEEVNLGGILFFESPHSTADVAFNDNSLKRSELPPLQLSADNVPLIGRDVGVLGNIMAVPRIPAGVVRLAAA